MATRILNVTELLELAPHLPVKQEFAGRKVLLFAKDGGPACKLVSDEAWSLDASSLLQCNKPALAKDLSVIVEEGALWVVFPAPQAKPKERAMTNFGLGAFVVPELPQASRIVPSVPEPWMGTYGEKLPVIPIDCEDECGGLEWARRQRTQESVAAQAPAKPKMQQATISSMFARAPMRVEPMDF